MGDLDRRLLQVTDLRVAFPIRYGLLRRTVGWVRAVDGVSFGLDAGETLGLVGESGSGKTTVARAIVHVDDRATGSVKLGADELIGLREAQMRRHRRRVQMIFQDPYASLDPRQTVGQILTEPLRVHGLTKSRAARQSRINELLDLVGLDATSISRYPHEFSGGQRQRIGIARALAADPELIICDEPVSALDVSVQAQVINLLTELQERLGVAYVFIAHDLAVVRHIARQLAVMYLGHIVEIGAADSVYADPKHPYTRALLSAAPVPDATVEKSRTRTVLVGDLPSPSAPPPGCPFSSRCPLRRRLGDPAICTDKYPKLQATNNDAHAVACHFHDQRGEEEERLDAHRIRER